ncbi:hypothetical protein Ani05nite_79820 [Amorphoplanes nipponensis]|uniref:Uncharacterized protein n=1 Tax=Actinoplanes nipponensis TaxID=135950 RepID=A0A919JPA6_9ACTN|nr:hypothetical protein [Actinoplanes nipponensis]GIE54448.1 hypothetical protein Ani05nite_79820 [Actinoplanes nipponensis]
MTDQPATAVPLERPAQPSPTRPWQQGGHPPIRVEPTADPVYPYALEIGDYATTTLAMTTAGVRALRDALTALLAHTSPAETQDFVADWARAHNAVVAEAPAEPAPAALKPADPPVQYVMAA